MWQKVNKIIKTGKTESISKITQAAYICGVADKIARRYGFGIVSFRSQALTISIGNNVLAQELKFKENQIIEEINRELKNNLIEKIKYRIGD